MPIDRLNIAITCGEQRVIRKTVQQAKINKINKIRHPVNEKQKNFRKHA